MTMTDPFASAPAEPEEAQQQEAPVVVPESPVEEPKKAPAKKASVTVDVKPVIQSAELSSKVTVTFKGGSGYDAPWIVVHANDLQDAHDQVSGDNAVTLASLMTQVQKAGGHFAGLYPTKAPVAAGGGSAPAANPSAPPRGAVSAPGGESRQCKHGEMTFKTGFSAKTNKTWSAFMCPSPKGTPDQCDAEWLR